MSRYRMYPTSRDEQAMLVHCSHERFVWNLAVEQQSYYVKGGVSANPPGSAERMRQLTEARVENAWLREGSSIVQQQALRDFDQAMSNFFNGTHRRPTWRKQHLHESFRIVQFKPDQHLRVLNRRNAEVFIPKVGWVRFRLSRTVPEGVKSFRVTRDRAGRWFIAFAAIPTPIPAPGTGEIVGVDRGVVHVAALSDGTFYDHARPDLDRQVKRLQRQLSRCKRGSNRRAKVKVRLAKAQARRADARKDMLEKATTDIARKFDVVRLEKLNVRNMTRSTKGTVEAPGKSVVQKAGLNRAILDKGWGTFAQRLEHKAKGRVEYVPAAYTSQRCSECGHVARENRESQAVFNCVACGYSANADVNAAKIIAAGHAVTVRGDLGATRSVKREPQLLAPAG